jgi:hypothetical protein
MYVVKIDSLSVPSYYGTDLNTIVNDESHARKFSLLGDAECFLLPIPEPVRKTMAISIMECENEEFAHVTPRAI